MMLSAFGQFLATRLDIVEGNHFGKALHAVNGVRVELAQRLARP